MWNSAQYLKFADQRARPFFDLTGQIQNEAPRVVADLGCGPGGLTRTLLDRWPNAKVVGVDNSPEMLAQTAAITAALPPSQAGSLQFVQADLTVWEPPEPLDVLVSNAALQWVPRHVEQLTRLVGMLAPGGTLAVQMPNRFHTASHRAVEETSADPRWQPRLAGVGLHRDSVLPLLDYVQALQDQGLEVDAWETAYYHVMTGEHPVLEWLKGTALRPILAALGADGSAYQAELAARLARAYPPRGGATVFPMPRLFFVARKPG